MKLSTSILLGTLVMAGLGTLFFLFRDGGSTVERDELMPTGPLEEERLGDGLTPELEAPAETAEEISPQVSRTAISTEEEEVAAAPKAKPKGPKLRGRVVDPNGFPITGAEVSVSSESLDRNMNLFGAKAPATETQTRANGSFEVVRGKLTERGVRVVVKARGYLALAESRTPDVSKGDTEVGTFVLEPGVILAGTVLDADGNPVPEVKLRRTTVENEGMFEGMMAFADALDETGSGRTETDEKGRFELPYEPTGDYVLVAKHDSYPTARTEGTTPLAGGEDRSLVLRFAPTALIAGRIVDFPRGRKHISVQARPDERRSAESTAPMDAFFRQTGIMGGEYSSKVAPDGTFSIEGLAMNVEYEVQAFEKDGILDRRPCSDEKKTESGTADLLLTWDAGASVVFDVEDASTKKPVRDVTVVYRWTTEGMNEMKKLPKRRSFPSSHIVLDELRPSPTPGTLELAAFADGYLEFEYGEVSVEEGESVDLGKISLELAPIVRVRVLDAATQKPLSRARVTMRPEGGDGEQRRRGPFGGGGESRNALAKTDRQGWCELPACSSGTATLTVVKSGYAKYRREEILMPGPGGSEEIVSMTRGGMVEVLVVDTSDLPVAKAKVHHQLPDGSTDSRETDREGVARLRNLEAGPHGFRASRPTAGGGGGRRGNRGNDSSDSEDVSWQTVAVVGGATSSIVLEVPSSASMRGIVTVRGNVVPQAEVEFLPGEEGSSDEAFRSMVPERMAAFMSGTLKTRSDDHGRFRFGDVPQGRHRVRVRRSGGALPHEVLVDVFEGENQVEVELPSARIEGRVVDSRGNAIQGATVRALHGEDDGSSRDAMAAAAAIFGTRQKGGGRTDYGGDFTIEDVPRDVSLVVEAQASGYVTNRSEEVTVKDGDVERGVNIVLSQAGSLRVEFQSEVGFFQMVTASYQGDLEPKPGRKMAVARGREAILRDLAPGEWRVTVVGRNGDDGDTVEVREGEESVLSLTE